LPLLAVSACAHHADDGEIAPIASASAPIESPSAPAPVAPVRAARNGRAFPDGVLALTWDDGPDLGTLELAEYLQREHVSATFFVVGAWEAGVSSDPGFGPSVGETGYTRLPLLGDLVALGHRIGNHTLHHALIGGATPDTVDRELGDAQRMIDPFVRDETRFFRVPGGYWTAAASHAVDSDPYLADLVGPIRWDVDAKDWEGAVWCESTDPPQAGRRGHAASPARDCEQKDGRWRVRADVMAERYERAIASAGRGIVLMHDRVGDVGSRYALDMAERLVPWLVARGYVFAAPVLGFGPSETRWAAPASEMRLADVDGDGRADACVREGDGLVCATSAAHVERGLERAFFDDTALVTLALPARARSFELADVNGDGRADVCVRVPEGISCALARAGGGFGPMTPWSDDFSDAEGWGSDPAYDGTLRFADVDGDHRADVCARSPAGVVCARSTGAGFERARLWLPAMSDRSAFAQADYATSMALGDLDGDGRADVCARAPGGVFCALSTKTSFGRLSRWSSEKMQGPLELGDLNGDGRADVCASGWCALSNGRALTKPTQWVLDEGTAFRRQWLGDINGDGRSDICGSDGRGVRCAVAP
jgi:peptidoglycan/xylan/chitin deacetylase (PgdA/CDA1 family)